LPVNQPPLSGPVDDRTDAVTLTHGNTARSIARVKIEYIGCSLTGARCGPVRPPTSTRRSRGRSRRTFPPCAPCPIGRGRSARRVTPRDRCPDRVGGVDTDRCGRDRGDARTRHTHA
jgi:hypothetical protein